MPKYTPINNTYQEHTNDARYKAKEYSLIPEFRISEHIDYYINEKAGDFLATNNSLFSITGSAVPDSSEDNFVQIYTNSEFFKNYEQIRKDHKDLASPTRIELKASAIMNFVPYEGFYPVERCLQLAQLFSQSYGPNMILTGSEPSMRPITNVLFGPGILFNSIKSGLAVSHPALAENHLFPGLKALHVQPSGNIDLIAPSSDATPGVSSGDLIYPEPGNSARCTTITSLPFSVLGSWQGFVNVGKKIPFEAILEPASYVVDLLYDLEPHPSASIDTTASLGSGYVKYSLGANNFLASSIDFFNKGGALTSLVSETDANKSFFNMQLNKKYKMRVVLQACENYNIENIIREAANSPGGSAINVPFNNWAPASMAAMSLTASTEFSKPTFQVYTRPNFDNDSLPEETTTFKRDRDTYVHDGSAFGPPLFPSAVRPIINGVDLYTLGTYGQIGYEAYTPPYFEGFSFVEFEFQPFAEDGTVSEDDDSFRHFSLEEIFDNITASYYRYSTTPAIDFWGSYFINSNLGGKGISPNPLPSAIGDPFQGVWEYTSLTGSNSYIAPGRIFSKQNTIANTFNDSVNDLGVLRNKKIIYDNNGGISEIREDENAGARWYIQTKFEAPIFDYSNPCVGELPSSASQNIGTGLWHNYGTDLAEDKALYLQVTDAPAQFFSGTQKALLGGTINDVLNLEPQLIHQSEVGSLADVVGFSRNPIMVGGMTDKRRVSEAIVAIPFIDKGKNRRFFKLDEDLVELAKTGDTFNIAGRGTVSAGESVKKTVQAMQKYVIPPKFDFLTYDGKEGRSKVDPIVMYFFEFNYDFTREDIKRIWHNVAPDFKIKEATTTIGHEFLENELLDGFYDQVRWMVFKVKQKAEWNYFAKTLDSADDQRFQFKFNVNDAAKAPDYSYNWPYDFMSLIEFGKIEGTVYIESEEETNRRRNKQQSKKKQKPKKPLRKDLVELQSSIDFPPPPDISQFVDLQQTDSEQAQNNLNNFLNNTAGNELTTEEAKRIIEREIGSRILADENTERVIGALNTEQVQQQLEGSNQTFNQVSNLISSDSDDSADSDEQAAVSKIKNVFDGGL